LNLLLQAWPKNPAKPQFTNIGLPGGLLAAKKAVQGALPKPPLGNTNESSALWIQSFATAFVSGHVPGLDNRSLDNLKVTFIPTRRKVLRRCREWMLPASIPVEPPLIPTASSPCGGPSLRVQSVMRSASFLILSCRRV
jgi:hypothetical protein